MTSRPHAASAGVGAAVWLLLLSSGWSIEPIRDVDRFLLLAILVIAPLGLSLCESALPARPPARLPVMHALAAACAVASFAVGHGIASALLSTPWLLFAARLAYAALPSLARMTIDLRRAPALCCAAATLDLAVGAAWMVASRLGIEPFGFGEPFVSLTAIHFHYAGFATAMLAAAATARMGSPTRRSGIVVKAIVCGPPAVAAGFLLSPLARVLAVSFFATGVVGLATYELRLARTEVGRTASVLLALSALTVLFTIACAVGYALGEWLAVPYLTVPRMVKVHGWVNALGFTVPGLLAFTIASARANQCASELSSS